MERGPAQTQSGAVEARAKRGSELRSSEQRDAVAKGPSVHGLDFPRYFTLPGVDPFDEIEWELRSAIIELGRGLAGHDEDFAAYRRRLRSAGKRSGVAAVAVGHRAHRLAFAMLRSQEPYDPQRWAAAVAGGPVMAKTGGRPTRTT